MGIRLGIHFLFLYLSEINKQNMTYSEVKDKLEQNGFNLSYYQTDGYLPLMQFEHPTINGSIDVSFDDDNVPEEIKELEEIDIFDERILNINIFSVCFNIDVSISYMSDGVVDVNGSTLENIIYLNREDLIYFDKVLDIISNPYAFLDYSTEYSKNWAEFTDHVKRFVSVLKNFNINHQIFKTSGDENTLYPDRIIEFKQYGFEINFCFNVLTFKNNIKISNAGHYETLPINSSVVDFTEEFLTQYIDYLPVINKILNMHKITDSVFLNKGFNSVNEYEAFLLTEKTNIFIYFNGPTIEIPEKLTTFAKLKELDTEYCVIYQKISK